MENEARLEMEMKISIGREWKSVMRKKKWWKNIWRHWQDELLQDKVFFLFLKIFIFSLSSTCESPGFKVETKMMEKLGKSSLWFCKYHFSFSYRLTLFSIISHHSFHMDITFFFCQYNIGPCVISKKKKK